MFEIFDKVRVLIKSGSVRIDNNVFTLHYRLTVVLLMFFSLIVGTTKYFGDPIDCTATVGAIERVVDNYCWFNCYIIVPKDQNGAYEEGDSSLPAFTQFKSAKNFQHHAKYKVNYLYIYQWIEFILFAQAVAFFVPRYLWRYCWEHGRVKALTENFNLVTLKHDDDKQKHLDIVNYFMRNKVDHLEYALKFSVCEILNFANVLLQYLILDKTLRASWKELAADLLTSDSNHDWKNPVHRVFPNVARCDIPVPAGGGPDLHPEWCVLPINVFVTKFYIILWFYFLWLTILSGLSLVYRLLTVISPPFRSFLIQRIARSGSEECIRVLRPHLGFGDWFILYLVGKNMDPFSFNDVLHEFKDRLTVGRPSFALIGNDKLYTGDIAAMLARKDSQKVAPK